MTPGVMSPPPPSGGHLAGFERLEGGLRYIELNEFYHEEHARGHALVPQGTTIVVDERQPSPATVERLRATAHDGYERGMRHFYKAPAAHGVFLSGERLDTVVDHATAVGHSARLLDARREHFMPSGKAEIKFVAGSSSPISTPPGWRSADRVRPPKAYIAAYEAALSAAGLKPQNWPWGTTVHCDNHVRCGASLMLRRT